MSEPRELTSIEEAVLLCVFASQEQVAQTLAVLERDSFIVRRGNRYEPNPNLDWILRTKSGRLSVSGPTERLI